MTLNHEVMMYGRQALKMAGKSMTPPRYFHISSYSVSLLRVVRGTRMLGRELRKRSYHSTIYFIARRRQRVTRQYYSTNPVMKVKR